MDGELQAFEDIVRTRPDLLIVDLVLRNDGTHLSGWELVLLSRLHRQLRDVPLIVCSGDTIQLAERADQLAELADLHILAKPFGVDELQSLVARLLAERVGALSGAQLQPGRHPPCSIRQAAPAEVPFQMPSGKRPARQMQHYPRDGRGQSIATPRT